MPAERHRFRYFGPGTTLTPLAQMVMREDIAGLDAELGKSWQLNAPFSYCTHCDGLALELALVESRYKVIDYLLAKGADLNVPKAPAMTSAVHTLDTALLDRLLAAGADITATNTVGYNALTQSVAWKYAELIPYLEARGLSFANNIEALQSAVFNGQRDLVEHALKTGADANGRKAAGRGGTQETLLHSAVQRGDMEMAKLLVAHGADPARGDRHGQKPYLWAMMMGHPELSDWLRSLEPAASHDRDAMTALARRMKAPDELVECLRGDECRLGEDSEEEPAVELLPIEDVYVFTWEGGEYLGMMKRITDEAPIGEIVWSPKHKCVCAIDIEHGELLELGSWDAFAADTMGCLVAVWDR